MSTTLKIFGIRILLAIFGNLFAKILISRALEMTFELMPDYFEKTLRSRLVDGVGSRTYCTSAVELLMKIGTASWVPYYHQAIGKGCIAFSTSDIAGKLGIVKLSTLDSDVSFYDPKCTGNVQAFVSGESEKLSVCFTVLILGYENGKLVMFTLHPGDPVRPSEIKDLSLVGKKMSAKDAIELGFQYAKVSG